MNDSDFSDLDLLGLATAERRNCEKLPRLCFAFIACHPAGERIVGIRRGQTGYFKTTLDDPGLTVENALDIVAAYNEKLEVSREQKEAMVSGSMFGWGGTGADPATYAGRLH